MSQVSITASQKQAEAEKLEAQLVEIRKRYTPIVDKTPKNPVKMVGLNPNMRPTASQSTSKIFPMQGLWSSKQLMKSTNQTFGVKPDELHEDCKQRNKGHFKKMYEQKEYMEEYLKFKEVIAGMKK